MAVEHSFRWLFSHFGTKKALGDVPIIQGAFMDHDELAARVAIVNWNGQEGLHSRELRTNYALSHGSSKALPQSVGTCEVESARPARSTPRLS